LLERIATLSGVSNGFKLVRADTDKRRSSTTSDEAIACQTGICPSSPQLRTSDYFGRSISVGRRAADDVRIGQGPIVRRSVA